MENRAVISSLIETENAACVQHGGNSSSNTRTGIWRELETGTVYPAAPFPSRIVFYTTIGGVRSLVRQRKLSFLTIHLVGCPSPHDRA